MKRDMLQKQAPVVSCTHIDAAVQGMPRTRKEPLTTSNASHSSSGEACVSVARGVSAPELRPSSSDVDGVCKKCRNGRHGARTCAHGKDSALKH